MVLAAIFLPWTETPSFCARACSLLLFCDSKLEPMEKAKLNLMIAYAADSLFYMFLKTQVCLAAPCFFCERMQVFSLRYKKELLSPPHLPPCSCSRHPLFLPWLTDCLGPCLPVSLSQLSPSHPFDSHVDLFAQGASTEDHPVTEELARIKTYMSKLKELGQGAVNDQQRLKLNKDAAQRFISAGLRGGGGDGENDTKSKHEKPDTEESGKKKKKKTS